MKNVGTSSASVASVAGRLRAVLREASSRFTKFALVALAAACGHGIHAPTERLASTEAAIRTAKELDAHGDERTALLVQLAEEEVAIARNRMMEGENQRADLALQRAKSDAELASMLIREKTATAGARKAREHLDAKTADSE
jgi:hypothetical protein